ncbi:MAG: 60S ribosomal export protein NMD3 [Candidatus Marsarchaeota archaeon]|nr:60S ribosomal export protein NMD3 [Candidatus Marsarchaeota archaeon]
MPNSQSMERICPRCGISERERAFAGEWCINCRLSLERPKWPSVVEVTRCPKCGKIWRERGWKHAAPTLIAKLVEAKMERAGLEGHYNIESGIWEGVWRSGAAKAGTGAGASGASIPYTHPVRIAYTGNQCTDCERSSGNYHEAIIQLRGDEVRVNAALKRLRRRLEHRTFVTKIEPMHGGQDIYVGVKKDVESVIRNEGYKFTHTDKLVGQREGKRLYRSTYLLRLEGENAGGGRDEPEVKVPRRERAKPSRKA